MTHKIKMSFVALSLSCCLARSLTCSHSLTLSHSLFLPISFFLSRSCSLSPSHLLCRSLAFSLCRPSHSRSRSYSSTFFRSLRHTHIHEPCHIHKCLRYNTLHRTYEWALPCGWRRCMKCFMFIGHFLPKTPIFSDSFAEGNLRIKAFYECSTALSDFVLSCILICASPPALLHRPTRPLRVHVSTHKHPYMETEKSTQT